MWKVVFKRCEESTVRRATLMLLYGGTRESADCTFLSFFCECVYIEVVNVV